MLPTGQAGPEQKPGMGNESAPASYTRPAVALHWVSAALLFAAFPLGLYVSGLRLSPAKLELAAYHKWLGISVFLVAAVRLAWRLTHRPPERVGARSPWQDRAAAATHGSLYVLMLVLPLSGWLFSSAAGVPTVYLGIWQLPDLVGRDRALAGSLRQLHQVLGWMIAVLVVTHVAAALKHEFVDRDGLMHRMGLRSPRAGSP